MKQESAAPLLEVKHLKKYFPIHAGILRKHVGDIRAVDDVSFQINHQQTLGLVGESGCGKTTVGRTLLQLYSPTSGEVLFDGMDLATITRKQMHAARKNLQMIFQDPYESLNPKHTIGKVLEEPLYIHRYGPGRKRRARVDELLDRVGLPRNSKEKFPHEFSGGQRQRIGIARAIALGPKLIVCDEPVSALDVSIQSQILNLLLELQEELNLALLFIAHDLAVVKHISDRVAVMYLGEIVELADAEELCRTPRHPYTEALISAVPTPDPKAKRDRIILQGEIPSPRNPPSGCRFHTRCPYAQDLCKNEVPPLRALDAENRFVACHYPRTL